jgi:ankyrin repeat protein
METLHQLFLALAVLLSIMQTSLPFELFLAVNRGDTRAVKELLRDFRVPVHIHKYQPTDPYGFEETVLLCSIKRNGFSAKIFNLILANHADINQTAHNGLSPLQKALLCKNEAAAQALIIRDADTKAKLIIDKDLQLNGLELAEKMNLKNCAQLIKKVEQKCTGSNNTH